MKSILADNKKWLGTSRILLLRASSIFSFTVLNDYPACVRQQKMTDLNTNLQSYLSKGDQNSGSGFGKFNLGKLNFFQKKNQTPDDVSESNDVANGWFTQAKADPCMPSLVRYTETCTILKCITVRSFGLVYL